MTVLVTGSAGYIGSHMVHALLEAGEQAVVLDNLSTGFDWAVPPGATLIAGDAGDQSRVGALIAAHRIDAIIHFAASIVVPCVDGSELARAFFTFAALVGAAMCSAC